MKCRCPTDKKNKSEYHFGLDRNFSRSADGATFTSLDSDIFFSSLFIRKDGEKVLILAPMRNQEGNGDIVTLLDFGASPGVPWTWDIKHLEWKSTIELSGTIFVKEKNDSVFRFDIDFERKTSDSYYLGSYLVSKSYGLVGLIFVDDEKKIYMTCYDSRFSKSLKKSVEK